MPDQVDQFLDWLRVQRNRPATTVRAYRQDLAKFVAFLRTRPLTGDLLSGVEPRHACAAIRSSSPTCCPTTLARPGARRVAAFPRVFIRRGLDRRGAEPPGHRAPLRGG